MSTFLQLRQNMIACQLKPYGIFNPALLGLMLHTPREKFVPPGYEALAYADSNLPMLVGLSDQTMLSPKTLAKAIQALDIQPTDHILEIGTGSGYGTLLLSRLGKKLTSIEIMPELTELAKKNLDRFSPHNIELILGNGASGDIRMPANTFHKILVTADYPDTIPMTLIHQLKPGGKLFAFVGKSPAQAGMLISKSLDNNLTQEHLFETVVSPLIDSPIHNQFDF